jgi:hypothetical protein
LLSLFWNEKKNVGHYFLSNLRMSVSLKHLHWYHTEGHVCLLWVVADDETWCHHSEPIGKATGMQWGCPTAPQAKKFKPQASAGEVIMTVFFQGTPDSGLESM